jgi:hypothetical protein
VPHITIQDPVLALVRDHILAEFQPRVKDSREEPDQAERRLRDEPQLEIVLLTARDEADLRRTHSHCFQSIDRLLEHA